MDELRNQVGVRRIGSVLPTIIKILAEHDERLASLEDKALAPELASMLETTQEQVSSAQAEAEALEKTLKEEEAVRLAILEREREVAETREREALSSDIATLTESIDSVNAQLAEFEVSDSESVGTVECVAELTTMDNDGMREVMLSGESDQDKVNMSIREKMREFRAKTRESKRLRKVQQKALVQLRKDEMESELEALQSRLAQIELTTPIEYKDYV